MVRHLLILLAISSIAYGQDNRPVFDTVLSGYKYPYPVHTLAITSQGQTLDMIYMDVQPVQPNGKTVLLLHGKNFTGAYWKTTIAALVKEGYRVVVPDQVGFGKSSKPLSYQYSFQQLAQNTKQILDALRIQKIYLLGHSMGGMLATRFALMYAGTVDKLVLENPIGLEDWKTIVPYTSVDTNYKTELKQDFETVKKYQLDNYYDGKWKAEYDEWVYLLTGWVKHPAYKTVAWNNALTSDMVFTQPVLYEFSNIKAPTLLIIGTRDRTAIGKQTVPDAVKKTMGQYQLLGKATQQKIAGSLLVELEDVGHLPHIEASEQFVSPLLKFLKQ
ncbi:MAG: alpha/beta hydrolase [Rhizobacter sp.]|nr:alpha/beta hydrolase [Ferruginibacter sp.]